MGFTRRIENFVCAHCGLEVTGDGFTNHCPRCLWSKHVDQDPGDRAESCGGLMIPAAARYQQETYTLYHRCERCGIVRRNRSDAADDHMLLILLTARPLPPDGNQPNGPVDAPLTTR